MSAFWLLPVVPADRALVERALAESGAERTPVPPESSYLGEVARAAQQELTELLLRGSEMLLLPAWALVAIALTAAGLAVLLVARALLPGLRDRRTRSEVGTVAALERAPAAARDAAAWRAELERRLAEDRVAEALEAAWWWLARSLAGEKAEPDWTSRDLVARAGREDLLDLVRWLDIWAYGPRLPAAAELRGLVGRLEAGLV